MRPTRPLLVTASPDLVDDALRLAAAAGIDLEVCADAGLARRSWPTAPLVLVGSDLARALADRRLPRRPDVIVVGLDLDDARVWESAVAVGAERVVFLPDDEPALVDRLADAGEGRRAAAATVCCVGGRGGAGASTLAAALAVTGMRRGARTLLLDADPLGGGLDLVLGGEDCVGARWPDLDGARGRVSSEVLYEALPHVDELTVLSWDRGDLLSVPLEAMQAILAAAQRGSDLVVVDLPRRLDDASAEAASRATVTLLVVPAEVRATAAAARVAAGLLLVATDVRLVVRGPAPARLSARDIADSLGLPLAGELAAEPGLAAALERGEPPGRRRGPLTGFCRRFLDTLLPVGGAAPGAGGGGPVEPADHRRRAG